MAGDYRSITASKDKPTDYFFRRLQLVEFWIHMVASRRQVGLVDGAVDLPPGPMTEAAHVGVNGLRGLVIDDHELIRDGMRRVLEDAMDFSEVRQAPSLHAGIALLTRGEAPDLILVDLHMPDSDGPRSLSALVEASPASSIVVMSASEAKEDVLESLSAGVDGYVPKSFGVPAMVAALQQVMDGGTFVPRGLARRTGSAVGADRRPAPAGLDHLTQRQQDVLAELRQGKSSKEIARQLGVAEGTVKIHLAAIYRVLGVNTRAAAIAQLSGQREAAQRFV